MALVDFGKLNRAENLPVINRIKKGSEGGRFLKPRINIRESCLSEFWQSQLAIS